MTRHTGHSLRDCLQRELRRMQDQIPVLGFSGIHDSRTGEWIPQQYVALVHLRVASTGDREQHSVIFGSQDSAERFLAQVNAMNSPDAYGFPGLWSGPRR